MRNAVISTLTSNLSLIAAKAKAAAEKVTKAVDTKKEDAEKKVAQG